MRLRELVTDRDASATSPRATGGRSGRPLVRSALAAIGPQVYHVHVAFTTPYVLLGSTKKDWIHFLRRDMVGIKISSEPKPFAGT